MKPESLQKMEQALNKIASAQLLLEAVDDADLSEAIACLYSMIEEEKEADDDSAQHSNA